MATPKEVKLVCLNDPSHWRWVDPDRVYTWTNGKLVLYWWRDDAKQICTPCRQRGVTPRLIEQRKRDDALALVQSHIDRQAWEAGLIVVRRWAGTGREFNADEVRPDLVARGIYIKPTAMGALFGTARRNGWIERTGGKRATDVKGGHARSYDLWVGVGSNVVALAGRKRA